MVVIGAGRIGTALRVRAASRGLSVDLVDRTTGWEHLQGPAGDPVIVAVRNADLAAVVEQVPPHRLSDLVLVQNGAIRELLAELGLHDATRGILYAWAPSRGADFAVARWSPFTGPHAGEVVRWLGALGLPAEAVIPLRFTVYEVEKLVWLAVFGALGDAHDAPVGVLVAERRSEIDALTRELLPILRASWGVDIDPDWVVERLLGWSRAIPEFRAAVKEERWRTGWLQARARRFGLETPFFDHLLSPPADPPG